VIPFNDLGGSQNDSQAISTSDLIAMSQNHVTSSVALSPGGSEENSSELKLAMVRTCTIYIVTNKKFHK
jgi:hypothetical protein